MKKKLEPFLQEAVDKLKNGKLDGFKYEYETRNPHGNETFYHEVSIEDGQIKDSIQTYGKSFNGKENERYTVSSEKIIKTDIGIANFMEKAPYRFVDVLDQQEIKEYKQRKEVNKAVEIQERLSLLNSTAKADEPDYEPDEIASNKTDSVKTKDFLKGLGKLFLILTALYLLYKVIKKFLAWLSKWRKQKSEKKI